MDIRDRSPSNAETAMPISGDLAARYQPLFEIGRGGMGTIEVALERRGGGEDTFERIVALKRMLPHASRERRQTEMFLREAHLAANLVHPNVVHAFDFGEIDGELFLAMEYVEGESLSAIVRAARERSRALPPAIVAAILAAACEGLHAAHELRDPQTGALLNVIHRDVSPHNVMVSYEGHVKLLDFGVAKIDSASPLTRTGEVKGKTAYMSPEQAMGETLDRRSDLFSMGAVLYECVSGQRMFAGTDLEILRRLAQGALPSLADAAPVAPTELVTLHARLVARDPNARPSSAADVASELRAFVESSGVRADAVVIAEMMASLFAGEAAERRRVLDERLARHRVPARGVEVLRRSLAGPTALATIAPGRTQAPRSQSVPAAIAPSAPRSLAPGPAPSVHPQATRSGVVASAVVGLAIAAGIVAFSTTRGGTAASATTAPAIAAPVAASTPTSTSTPTPTPTPTPTSTPTPTPTPTPSPTPTPTPTSPHPTPRPRHPKPAASSPVDVDRNPL